MKNIQAYIDKGWYTVPLTSIKRDKDGSKQVIGMPSWKEYTTERNTRPSPAGAVITGERSGIVVVDMDDKATQEFIDKLAGEHSTFKVATARGAHYYYRYTKDIPRFKLHNKDINLDFQTDEALIYLPTDAAEGYTIIDNSEPAGLPDALHTFLAIASRPTQTQKATVPVATIIGTPLASLDKGSPAYWKRLTPKHLRHLPQYKKNGYITPNDVPNGEGNDYLISIASILAADPTIDEDAYTEHLMYVHDQWEYPWEESRFRTLHDNYRSGRYVPFQYQEGWEDQMHHFKAAGYDYIVWFDPTTYLYNLYNETLDQLSKFKDVAIFSKHLSMLKRAQLKTKDLYATLKHIVNVSDRTLPGGFYDEQHFNEARLNKYLRILQGELEPVEYKHPDFILKLIKHLWPENTEYILGFLRRKLTKFEYSPVVIVLFEPIGGSGKTLFFHFVLKALVGQDQVAEVGPIEFRDKYNSWIINSLFSLHDEYDKMNRTEVTAISKRLSASDSVGVRPMYGEVQTYKHSNTQYYSSNEIAIDIQSEDDRRYFISSPKGSLKEEEWFNVATFKEDIQSELESFAYYLYKEVQDLPAEEYTQAPESTMKDIFISDSQTLLRVVVESIRKHKWDKFQEAIGYEPLQWADHGIISVTHIVDAINEKFPISANKVTREIQQHGFISKRDFNKKYDQNRSIAYIEMPRDAFKDLVLFQGDDR